jgi:hypothetical protein
MSREEFKRNPLDHLSPHSSLVKYWYLDFNKICLYRVRTRSKTNCKFIRIIELNYKPDQDPRAISLLHGGNTFKFEDMILIVFKLILINLRQLVIESCTISI